MAKGFVQVGETVEHEWVCGGTGEKENSRPRGDFGKMFGLLVHDCYIGDGRARKELIIDKRGFVLGSFFSNLIIFNLKRSIFC